MISCEIQAAQSDFRKGVIDWEKIKEPMYYGRTLIKVGESTKIKKVKTQDRKMLLGIDLFQFVLNRIILNNKEPSMSKEVVSLLMVIRNRVLRVLRLGCLKRLCQC